MEYTKQSIFNTGMAVIIAQSGFGQDRDAIGGCSYHASNGNKCVTYPD